MKSDLLLPFASNSVWQNSYNHVIISLDGGQARNKMKTQRQTRQIRISYG